MDKKALSEQAKLRLRIAAGLLRTEGIKLDCTREQFYEKIQESLADLSADRKVSLKVLVDWVEDYDRTAI